MEITTLKIHNYLQMVNNTTKIKNATAKMLHVTSQSKKTKKITVVCLYKNSYQSHQNKKM